MQVLLLTLLTSSVLATNVPSSVVQLSDKFIDVKDDGYWFVKLYAPWCGHCKRMAPIWEHVGHAVNDKNPAIRISKMDCTLYSKACSSLGVTGYPTLMFFRNGQQLVYEGEREKEALVDYALKCASPAVTPIQTLVQYNKIKEASAREPVFVYVQGEKDSSPVAEAYKKAADEMFSRSSFYSIAAKIAPTYMKEGNVYVLRDKAAEEFKGKPESLLSWCHGERLPVVAKATGSTLPALSQADKLLVLLVVTQLERFNQSSDIGKFHAIGTSAARKARKDEKLKSRLQFAWLDGPGLASSIAMGEFPVPGVLVLNYSSYEYFIPQDAATEMTEASLLLWLKDTVLSDDAQPLGGRSLWMRTKRLVYDVYTNVTHMFSTNPILACCLFGVPLGFLSIITYTLCSADFSVDRDEIYPEDEDEEEEEEGDEDGTQEGSAALDHEKAE